MPMNAVIDKRKRDFRGAVRSTFIECKILSKVPHPPMRLARPQLTTQRLFVDLQFYRTFFTFQRIRDCWWPDDRKKRRSNQGGSESRSPNAGVLHVLLPMRMRRKRPAPCDRLQVGRGFNRLLAPGLATHVGAFFEGRGECLYGVHAWTSNHQHRCMSFGAFLSSCTNSFRTSLMLSESSTIFVMYSGTSQRCFAAPVARHGVFRVRFAQYSRISMRAPLYSYVLS